MNVHQNKSSATLLALINVQLISFPSGIRSIGYLAITSIKPQDRVSFALHCFLLITAMGT